MSHAPQFPSTEVAPGIHRLTGGVVNFYLVEQSGGLTLVDAGTPGDWRVFLWNPARLPRPLGPTNRVVLGPPPPAHGLLATPARPARPARASGPHARPG